MSASAFDDSLASRFVVSPALEEFCGVSSDVVTQRVCEQQCM